MGHLSKLPPLGIAVLFVLAVLMVGGIPSETHTTYINGSRVQSPELIAVGNLTVGNTTNASANSVTRIYANGTTQRTNTSTGAVLPLNLTSPLAFGASNLSIYPNGTIANAVMVGCNGCASAIAAVINSQSYVGNDTANRAIAHGLGKIPRFVTMVDANGAYGTMVLVNGTAAIYQGSNTANTIYAVTGPDATNFYVGNAAAYPTSANGNGITYYWTAVG